LPFELSPVQIIIVPILVKGKEENLLKKCNEIYETLKNKYIVRLDDSEESPGSKFYFWELKGVPLRIEIGSRDIEKKQVVIVKRHDGQKYFVSEQELENKIEY